MTDINEGIPTPNYTQVPNIILDNIHLLSDVELRVMLVACRQTFGWHRQTAPLSSGYLEAKTGKSKQGVRNGVKKNTDRKWLKKVGTGKRGVSIYGLNFSDLSTELTTTSQPSRQEHVKPVDTEKKVKESKKKKDIPDKPEGGFSSGDGSSADKCEHGKPLHSVRSVDGTHSKVCICERDKIISTTPATIAKLERETVSLTELENTCPNCNELRHDGTCLCDNSPLAVCKDCANLADNQCSYYNFDVTKQPYFGEKCGGYKPDTAPLVTGDGLQPAIYPDWLNDKHAAIITQCHLYKVYLITPHINGMQVHIDQLKESGYIEEKPPIKTQHKTTTAYRLTDKGKTLVDAPIVQETIKSSQQAKARVTTRKTENAKKPKSKRKSKSKDAPTELHAELQVIAEALAQSRYNVPYKDVHNGARWGIMHTAQTFFDSGDTADDVLLVQQMVDSEGWKPMTPKKYYEHIQTARDWQAKRKAETTARPQHREIRIHVDEEYQ